MLVYYRLARLQRLLPLAPVAQSINSVDTPEPHTLCAVECPAPEAFHQAQPADIGENSHAKKEHGEQDQAAADGAEGNGKAIPDRLPENATGTLRQARAAGIIHRCERRTGNHDQHQAEGPDTESHPVERLLAMALQQNHKRAIGQ